MPPNLIVNTPEAGAAFKEMIVVTTTCDTRPLLVVGPRMGVAAICEALTAIYETSFTPNCAAFNPVGVQESPVFGSVSKFCKYRPR